MKKIVNYTLLLGFFILLFFPLLDFKYQHFDTSGRDEASLIAGIFTYAVIDGFGLYNTIILHGLSLKFPIIPLAVVYQTLVCLPHFGSTKPWSQQLDKWWGYLLLGILFFIFMIIFRLSFPEHITRLTWLSGAYFFFVLLATGIIKSLDKSGK